MKRLDLDSWSRKDIFNLFSKVDYPFYSVTIPVEVTNVKRVAKEEGLSFYYLMVWLCTAALNAVEEFRIQIKGDSLFVSEELYPSFTCMRKGEDSFVIVNNKWQEDYREFCKVAERRLENQKSLFGEEAMEGCPIYISCTPWFDFTSLTNERNFDKDDTIPRIAWGKYYEENGKLMVHLSIDVNHRTIDGVHIGRLKEELDRRVAGLGR